MHSIWANFNKQCKQHGNFLLGDTQKEKNIGKWKRNEDKENNMNHMCLIESKEEPTTKKKHEEFSCTGNERCSYFKK